jgi:hypothetical protein
MTPAQRRIGQVLEGLFLLGFFTLLFFYTWRPNWDIDIFWHIRTGEWITANLALPSTDLFSATDPTRAWAPFQWLYEVIVYQVESRLDFTWVRALHVALFMGSFVGFYLVFRRILGSGIAASVLLIVALVLAADRLRIRPEAFNFFFLVVLLPDLLGLRKVSGMPRPWTLVRIVVVSALWANIHAGGAMMLPLALGAVAVGRFAQWFTDRTTSVHRDGAMYATWLALASGLSMLAMPGFIRGVWTAFHLIEGAEILIPEWHPPVAYFLPSMAGPLSLHHLICGLGPYLILALVFVLLAVGAIRLLRRQSLASARDAGLVALALFMALLAIRSARFIYLDIVALAALAWFGRDRIDAFIRPMATRVVLIVLGLVLFAATYDQQMIRERKGLSKAISVLHLDLEPGSFPVKASDAIESMRLEGRIFNFASWGGYLIYRHFPRCSVYSDGRGNFTAEEQALMVDAHKPYERDEAIEALWQRFPFDILVMPRPTFPLVEGDPDRWVLAYRDEQAEVYLRVYPGNEKNMSRVLDWWRTMGLTFRNRAEFEDRYRHVLAIETLAGKEVAGRLNSAGARTASNNPRELAGGYYDGALILFDAGLYQRAAKFFAKALDLGMYHSTAALYLVWSNYLAGRHDDARNALNRYFLSPDGERGQDYGPLRQHGRLVLSMLADRLGVPVGIPEN